MIKEILKRLVGLALGFSGGAIAFILLDWIEVGKAMYLGMSLFGICIAVEMLNIVPRHDSFYVRVLVAISVLFPFYCAATYVATKEFNIWLPSILAILLGVFVAWLSQKKQQRQNV